jgi:glycosyltransferase involved in cell wall biosynthesis
VADDGSSDGTAKIAEAAGATVVRSERVVGKGGAVTLAAREALRDLAGAHELPAGDAQGQGSGGDGAVVVLCDGDLGDSAERLRPLVDSVLDGDTDLAVAVFSKRVGGGLGLALGFARWAIRRRCGLALRAPISGQRAMRAGVLTEVLPFAHGFGMEIGMTIDAARAGHRVVEVELDLVHRATGRTLSGFVHRGRQLLDFARAYRARR